MISSTEERLHYFEEQVNIHHKKVLAYALSLNLNHHTAEDLVQDSFLTAFRKLAEIDITRNLGSFVRGILRFKYLERARNLKEICLGDEIIEIIDQQFSQWDSEEYNRTLLFDKLKHCIEKLTLDQQKIINMFYTGKKKCETIAAAMKINEATVRKRLERIRYELKCCIEKQQKEAI
jgi:RNA polymerase sigma factor (sigma-70 family)